MGVNFLTEDPLRAKQGRLEGNLKTSVLAHMHALFAIENWGNCPCIKIVELQQLQRLRRSHA